MERAIRGVTREGALGLAATLGAFNLVQLAGASAMATGHLWMLRLDDFGRAPALAWQFAGNALLAFATMPLLACGAAACFWAVRIHGPEGMQARRRIAAAWAASAVLATVAWIVLRRPAQLVVPYPIAKAVGNIAMAGFLGVLPAWWLAEAVRRKLRLARN